MLAALGAWEDLAAKGAQGLLVRYRCGAVRGHLWWRVFDREKFGDPLKLWALRQEAQEAAQEAIKYYEQARQRALEGSFPEQQ